MSTPPSRRGLPARSAGVTSEERGLTSYLCRLRHIRWSLWPTCTPIEIEPEVRSWLELLPGRLYRKVEEYAGVLAELGPRTPMPYSRPLQDGVSELRPTLDGGTDTGHVLDHGRSPDRAADGISQDPLARRGTDQPGRSGEEELPGGARPGAQRVHPRRG